VRGDGQGVDSRAVTGNGRNGRAVRLETARRFALSLPEESHFEKSSFRVRGKIFATVPHGGKHLHVHGEPDEAKALIDEAPDAFDAAATESSQ
jgi:hypothetical protein